MKIARRLTDVARASRPRSRERPAPARGQDARATAGGTPAPRFSKQVRREIAYALGNRNYEGRIFTVMVRPTEEVPWILHKFHMLRANSPAQISKHIAGALKQEAVGA